MSRVALRLLLLGAIGAAFVPRRTLAQSPAPDPAASSVAKRQVAKQYVDAGLAAQTSGDYETAITFYLKAYQLVPHPVLLFNMAQAHRLAGHLDQALSLYKRYLADDPHGAKASTARELVSEIEARRADDAREADEARRADRALAADEARITGAAHDASAPQVAATAPPTSPSVDPAVAEVRDTVPGPPAQPGRLSRIAGLAAGASGAAAVVVGIGFGLHARSLSSELSRYGAVYDPAKIHAGERADSIAIAGIAGGAALIATGAALYWWGYTQDRARERVSLVPLVGDRTAGLVVSGMLP